MDVQARPESMCGLDGSLQHQVHEQAHVVQVQQAMRRTRPWAGASKGSASDAAPRTQEGLWGPRPKSVELLSRSSTSVMWMSSSSMLGGWPVVLAAGSCARPEDCAEVWGVLERACGARGGLSCM